MTFNYSRESLWLEISQATPRELRSIQDRLDAWSRQLSPGTHQIARVWLLVDVDRMRVLTGAAIATGLLEVPRPEDACGSGDRLLRLAECGILRSYQATAAMQMLYAPGGRAVVELATGAGKTLLAAAIAAVIPDERWLYLVTNTELAQQTALSVAGSMERMAIALRAQTGQIRCKSYQSASDADLEWATGVICDEVHSLPARNRALRMEKLRVRWWLGMSATPTGRTAGDNALVLGLLGPVVYVRKLNDLKRYLAKGKVVPIQYDHLRGELIIENQLSIKAK